MSESAAFGPNLRRQRLRRGVTLEQIAATTRVSVDLWKGLEENNFSRWPRGIYARAWVRSYASAIGVDPETTVDDFCKWFPHGDRRVAQTVREHAAIIAHDDLRWTDDLGKNQVDRRAAGRPVPPSASTLAERFVTVVDALLRAFESGIYRRSIKEFLKLYDFAVSKRKHHHEI